MPLRITAQNAGYRRCGVGHPAQSTDHPADRFTEEQIAILKADPMLTVVEIEDAPDPEAEKKAAAEKTEAEKKAEAEKKEAAEKAEAEKKAQIEKKAADAARAVGLGEAKKGEGE